ncbi:hypothetical protein MPER_04548 [Moniliophthora perniciosa FA553]|nr:hypothetical protein MPER_04548 [Moniliophthora perniciosa FA553]
MEPSPYLAAPTGSLLLPRKTSSSVYVSHI